MTATAGAQDARIALVEELNARLLAGPTATAVLAAWCAEHGMADPARIHAERVPGPAAAASPGQRARLGVGADETLGYRRVRLMCGAHLMSEAENWYVPGRLTPAMRSALADTDTPFGAVMPRSDRSAGTSRRRSSGMPARSRTPCCATAPWSRAPTGSRWPRWSRPIPAACWSLGARAVVRKFVGSANHLTHPSCRTCSGIHSEAPAGQEALAFRRLPVDPGTSPG
ncbi:MAG: hypothetical protein WDN44_14780 [Sphingomonas sp.]